MVARRSKRIRRMSLHETNTTNATPERRSPRRLQLDPQIWRSLQDEAERRHTTVKEIAAERLTSNWHAPQIAEISTTTANVPDKNISKPTAVSAPPAIEKRGRPRHSITLDAETWHALREEAQKRKMTAAELGAELVAWSVFDNLIDAVIDNRA
jgi:predicted DNA-binding ribbon-helix-helix protein